MREWDTSRPRLAPEPDMRSVEGRARRSELLVNRREAAEAGIVAASRYARPIEEQTECFLVPLERYVIVLGKDGLTAEGEDYYRVEFKVDRNDIEEWSRWTAWAVETFA